MFGVWQEGVLLVYSASYMLVQWPVISVVGSFPRLAVTPAVFLCVPLKYP